MKGTRYPRYSLRKCQGFPRPHILLLTHNMARPPKNMLATDFRVSPKKNLLPVNLSVMICLYAAACWGNHSCSHWWLSSTTFKMPSALLPVGLQLIPLCF